MRRPGLVNLPTRLTLVTLLTFTARSMTACGSDDEGNRCEAAEATGDCLAKYALTDEPGLPADLLSDEEIAACTEADGNRDDAGELTQAGADCIARALGLNAGVRAWWYQEPVSTDRSWSVHTRLNQVADCCATGCSVSIDAVTGRPLQASVYGSCP